MAFEVFASFAEFLGEAAYLIRYGKSKTPPKPVSAITACLVFLLLGLLFCAVFAALFSALSPISASIAALVIVSLCGTAGWRMRSALGFPLSLTATFFYLLSFSIGVASAILLTAF